ncbi:MAG: hypothetical protein ABI461_02975, partial [Polyangiaceae bacterium]
MKPRARFQFASLRVFVGAFIGVFFLQLACASNARAKDPDRVEWSKDWPRVRLVEVINVVGLTLASYLISAEWTPPSQSRWSGPILFDKAVRSVLKGQTLSAQSSAADMADYFYKFGTLAPYVVDVYAVALGVHQNADVALQMLLINIQSLGLSGVVTLASERVVARARPYVPDCGAGGMVRDATGKLLLNTCDHVGDDASFYSGHAAATMTMAGTTCVHHQHLPLYGGGFPDLLPCLVMLGMSGATGIGRIVAD